MSRKYTPDEISRMATNIAYDGFKSADAVKVMEMLEQGAAALRRVETVKQEGTEDQSERERQNARVRAALLYCMDYIMHHLSDEHAVAHWLQDGCPDGICQSLKDPPAGEYEDLDLTDEEFEECLSVFVRTLSRQVIPGLPPLSDYKSVKGALA